MQGNVPDEEHVDEHGECAARIHQLEDALRPFAQAWKTVCSNEAVVRSLSHAQIASLCECELSGADFQVAARAIFNT